MGTQEVPAAAQELVIAAALGEVAAAAQGVGAAAVRTQGMAATENDAAQEFEVAAALALGIFAVQELAAVEQETRLGTTAVQHSSVTVEGCSSETCDDCSEGTGGCWSFHAGENFCSSEECCSEGYGSGSRTGVGVDCAAMENQRQESIGLQTRNQDLKTTRLHTENQELKPAQTPIGNQELKLAGRRSWQEASTQMQTLFQSTYSVMYY